MTASQRFVVRRCDGFYRYWHDVTPPASMREAHAAYDRLTDGGSRNTTPDDADYYDLFPADALPGWSDGPPPLTRRLHRQDLAGVEAHLLGLGNDGRRLRFFRPMTDEQIRSYVRGIDWSRSLLVGAIRSDRVIGLAEAMLDRSEAPRRAEIAVSVSREFRRRGLGRHLVVQAIDRAALCGVPHAHLVFLRENRPLRRILDALGGLVDRSAPSYGNEFVGVIGANRNTPAAAELIAS